MAVSRVLSKTLKVHLLSLTIELVRVYAVKTLYGVGENLIHLSFPLVIEKDYTYKVALAMVRVGEYCTCNSGPPKLLGVMVTCPALAVIVRLEVATTLPELLV